MIWRCKKPVPKFAQEVILEQDRVRTQETIKRLEGVTEQIRSATGELKALIARVADDEGISIKEIVP